MGKCGETILNTLRQQRDAISQVCEEFNIEKAEKAVDLLFNRTVGGCAGTVITTGMGKSGNIASKVSSTMTSTGTPSLFLHPGEALHGGLGILRPQDVILMFSKSGETYELLEMIPAITYHQIPVILITCKDESSLGRYSEVVISYPGEECCGADFVPTTSSTVGLVIGDALAMALMKRKKFRVEGFSRFHPGGTLGELVRDSIGKVEFS